MADPSSAPALDEPAGSVSRTPRRIGPDDRLYVFTALAATAVALMLPASAWRPFSLGPLARSALLTAVALPCVLRVLRPRSWVVLAALVMIAVPISLEVHSNFTDGSKLNWTRDHDGGVIATRAAAREVMAGRNPYTADYTDALPLGGEPSASTINQASIPWSSTSRTYQGPFWFRFRSCSSVTPWA